MTRKQKDTRGMDNQAREKARNMRTGCMMAGQEGRVKVRRCMPKCKTQGAAGAAEWTEMTDGSSNVVQAKRIGAEWKADQE